MGVDGKHGVGGQAQARMPMATPCGNRLIRTWGMARLPLPPTTRSHPFLLPQQALRHKMHGLPAGHPPDPGGAQGAGLRLPPALLRLHHL